MGTLVDVIRQMLQETTRLIMAELGFRENRLLIERREWSGGRVGAGKPKVTSSLLIEPQPRIREMGAQGVFSNGGLYQRGDVRADSITPHYEIESGTGGHTAEQLAPERATDAEEVVYIIEGPLGGEYSRVTLQRDHPLGYVLVLRRTNVVPKAPVRR
jgi:hypothetical protein